MCTFVLGTLPASAPLKSLERDFFRFTEVNAGSVASVLPPGELFGRMTGRHCDCGTALGIAAKMDRIAEHNRESIEHKLDRLQRKGWSRTRIERWLAQVEADQDRHAKVKADGAADKARWMLSSASRQRPARACVLHSCRQALGSVPAGGVTGVPRLAVGCVACTVTSMLPALKTCTEFPLRRYAV